MAIQFKNNLPGTYLIDIAKYGRSSMEDLGLFLGFEPTDPPTSLGLKYQQEWIDRWLKLLAELWQDETWELDNLTKLTDWVYRYAFPEVPSSFVPPVRINLEKATDSIIIMKLFHFAWESDKPERLYPLFQETFRIFSISEKSKQDELTNVLRLITTFSDIGKKRSKSKKTRNAQKIIASRVLLAFFGDVKHITLNTQQAHLLTNLGFNLNHPEFEKGVLEENMSHLLDDTIPAPVNVEFIRHGPILAVVKEKKGESVVLHDLIKHPDRYTRIQACEKILSLDCSNATKDEIKSYLSDLGSKNEFKWRSASEKCSDAIFHDFMYALDLFRNLLNFPLEYEKLTNDAWEAALNPRPETLIDRPPMYLKETIGDVACILSKNTAGADTMATILDSYLERIFFFPVDTAPDAYDLLMNITEIEKTKPGEILVIATNWLKVNKDDIWAYIIWLNLVLKARAVATGVQKKFFTTPDFFNELNKVFNILFLEDSNENWSGSLNEDRLRCLWNIRRALARYYLMYLDLNAETTIDGPSRVAMSWWMSREVVSVILSHISKSNEEAQVTWLKEKMATVIEPKVESMRFLHTFQYRNKEMILGRYYTLYAKAPLISAALSLIMPRIERSSVFDGLQNPTNALDPEFVDNIIDILSSRALLGEGQLPRELGKGEIPLLWKTPICISAPALLRKYYGDSFELLGAEKTQMIQLAETVSSDNFLREALEEFSSRLNKDEGPMIALTFMGLMVFITTHKEWPFSEWNLWLPENTIERVQELDSPWNSINMSALLSIVSYMQQTGMTDHLDDLGRQFIHIDINRHTGDYADVIVNQVVNIALLGYKLPLLDTIIAQRHSNKKIREILGKIKLLLEKSFSKIPAGFRSSVRELLNRLQDVPINTKE